VNVLVRACQARGVPRYLGNNANVAPMGRNVRARSREKARFIRQNMDVGPLHARHQPLENAMSLKESVDEWGEGIARC
jgi:hypothetical protein